MTQNNEKAIFGAGCFWHIEEYFSNVPGVTSTKVGYACGKTINPNYEEVCTGRTGHVEVVEVTFNSRASRPGIDCCKKNVKLKSE